MFATSVDIDVKRCLCIHSMAQLVDITLQSLLYQRQLVPEPVPTFIKHDSHAAEQFSEQYQKVARILQETFRSPNAGLISEFVILIGGTPYSPKEIYRIRVPTCRSVTHETDQENSSRDNGQPDQQQKGCVGPVCDELTAKEKRLVFSAVALSKTAVGHFENCPIPGKTDKVFMFIRTRGQLNTWTEGLAEDESFELPEDDVQQRRKIHQLRVQVHAPRCDGARSHGRRRESNGCDGGSEEYHNHRNISHHDDEDERDVEEEEEADENLMTLWYRIAPFFTNLH